MKKMLSLLLLTTWTVLFPGNLGAQSASQAVSVGKNTIAWSGSLPLGRQATLSASFSPATNAFMPGSAYAAPIYNASWTSTQNTDRVAAFSMTYIFNNTFKSYPTYFQGVFDIQGGGGGGGSLPLWEASGAFSPFFGPHSYYDIAYMASGYKFMHNDTAINKNDIKNLVDYAIDNIASTQQLFVSHISDNRAKIEYNQTNTLSPHKSTQTNCTCAVPNTPPCGKMCKGFFEFIGEYKDEPVIPLPVWLQAKRAGPQTQAAWQTVLGNILAHEQLHEAVYHRHFRDHPFWKTWAAIKREIHVCVDDPQIAKDIADEYLQEQNRQANLMFQEMHTKLQ